MLWLKSGLNAALIYGNIIKLQQLLSQNHQANVSWRTLFSDFQNLTHDVCQLNWRSRKWQIVVIAATRILQHDLQRQTVDNYVTILI